MDFSGKKALVLGGTSSIGLKTAELLAQKGAQVTVVGRHKPESAQDLIFVEYDFENFFNDELNSLNIYIKNADIIIAAYGPFIQKPLDETTVEDWQKMAVQNLALPGAVVSTAVSEMKSRNYGRIVLFGGTRTDSVHNYRTNSAYAAAKTGISVLTKSVSTEYAKWGITCNAVFPGFTSNCPENTSVVSENSLAQCVIFLIEHDELNGVLLNVDRGWQPGN